MRDSALLFLDSPPALPIFKSIASCSSMTTSLSDPHLLPSHQAISVLFVASMSTREPALIC